MACKHYTLSTQAPDIDILSQNFGFVIYKCRNCGICSRVTFEDERPDSALAISSDNAQNSAVKQSELELLRSARQQMGKQL